MTLFVKGGKQQSADSRPTVGRLSVDCCLTVIQLLANCWWTVGRQFFGGAVLHFFPELLVTITLEIAYFILIVSLDNGGPKMLPERWSLLLLV